MPNVGRPDECPMVPTLTRSGPVNAVGAGFDGATGVTAHIAVNAGRRRFPTPTHVDARPARQRRTDPTQEPATDVDRHIDAERRTASRVREDSDVDALPRASRRPDR